MISARHKGPSEILHLLGSVSAPVARGAHYCDRNANVTPLPQSASREITERIVNSAVIARELPPYPHNTQPPRDPTPEFDEGPADDDADADDYDEHDEDFDEDADRAAAYNDYLRDLDA